MNYIRHAQKSIVARIKCKRNFRGGSLRKELIKLTTESAYNRNKFGNFIIDGVSLIEHKLFMSKSRDSIKLWTELWQKTNGGVEFNLLDSGTIPQQIQIAVENLIELDKPLLSDKQAWKLAKTYELLFESIRKFLEPHFRKILKFSVNQQVTWVQISDKITKFHNNYSALFSNMDNKLRRTIAHGDIFIDGDIITLKDKNEILTYKVQEIRNKTEDLLFLLLVLYWGLSEVAVPRLIDMYKNIPESQLKAIVSSIDFSEIE